MKNELTDESLQSCEAVKNEVIKHAPFYEPLLHFIKSFFHQACAFVVPLRRKYSLFQHYLYKGKEFVCLITPFPSSLISSAVKTKTDYVKSLTSFTSLIKLLLFPLFAMICVILENEQMTGVKP